MKQTNNPLQVPNYYKIITKFMYFTAMKCKMSRNHFNHYASVESFLDDCKLIFRNCAVYNSVSTLGNYSLTQLFSTPPPTSPPRPCKISDYRNSFTLLS